MSDQALTVVTAGLPDVVRDTMPTVRQFQKALTLSFDVDGMAVKVDAWTKLVPRPQLALIVQELETALVPCQDPKAAVKMAKMLVDSYARQNIGNPDVYVRAISSVFAEYPVDLGWKAVDHITRTLRWLPERADVVAVLNELRGKRRTMLRLANDHIREHERREKEAAEPKRKPYDQWTDEEKAKFEAVMSRFLASTKPQDQDSDGTKTEGADVGIIDPTKYDVRA